MADLVPVEALTQELFPGWLRDTVRMASVRAAGSGAVRFRVDPGPAFERYAVLVQDTDYGGQVFNLTVSQRYLPYDPVQFVVSGNVNPDSAPEALWAAINQANLLAPAEYWRSGSGYTVRKPPWTVRTDARQPTAVRLMEALAAARAGETGIPHYLSRYGQHIWCSVNAPHRGEFYSVNPAGEWSLHYHPVTYPLDRPPGVLPDRVGTHPVVLAHLRNMARPSYAPWDAATEPLPVVESPGRAPLPKAAWPPEAFTVPFRAKGENLTAPEPEPAAKPEALPGARATKEIPMPAPEPEAFPAAITASESKIAPDSEGDSPPTDDPWEGVNAEVRLVPDAARFAQAAGLSQAGFVIDVKEQAEDAADRVCTVHFPGRTENVDLPNSLLTAAPPFPAVTTSQGEIASIETAEALLIDSAARVRCHLEWGGDPDPAANEDRIKLAKALGNACGIDSHDLVRQLDPMIDQQVSAYQAARAAHPAGRKRPGKRASEVAAADVPRARETGEKKRAATGTKARSDDQKTAARSRAAAGRPARAR